MTRCAKTGASATLGGQFAGDWAKSIVYRHDVKKMPVSKQDLAIARQILRQKGRGQ